MKPKYEIWDLVKTSHYFFEIYSIKEIKWEYYYDWHPEKDILFKKYWSIDILTN
jgi:hypothetical protein